jgi:CelD/BcsL family acetyltransferase involved in cellulose biosynthesis
MKPTIDNAPSETKPAEQAADAPRREDRPAALQVEAVTTEEGWQALEPAWDPLVERSAGATIFLTTEWLRPWWTHFRRPGDQLRILVARDGGSIVGFAPLYRRRVGARGLGSLRRLGFIGDCSGDSEYLDFIIEPGREGDVLAAFLDHIEAEGWDLAELCLLPKASPNYLLLERLAAERGYLVAATDVPCSSAELPGDWDAYLKTLQSRFRSKLRSLLRKLPPEHDATFDECTRAEELPERLESLFELHQQRWRAEGKPGSFASEARRRFYGEMAAHFLRRGWLRFVSLRFGERFVAHEFSFEHLGRVYYLQQGFDTECGRLSVGIALKAYVVRESIARGAREYDFLGGIAPHKEKWGAQPKWCVHLALARPGLRTRWHLWLPRFAQRLRERGRALAPKPLLRLKRAIQERLRQRRARRTGAGEEQEQG